METSGRTADRSSWPPPAPMESPHLHHLKKGRVSLRTAINQKKIHDRFDQARNFFPDNFDAADASFFSQSQAVLDGATAPAVDTCATTSANYAPTTATSSSSLPNLNDEAIFRQNAVPRATNSWDFTATDWNTRPRWPSGTSSVSNPFSGSSCSGGSGKGDLDDLLADLWPETGEGEIETSDIHGDESDEVMRRSELEEESPTSTARRKSKDKHNQTEKNRRHNLNQQIKDLEDLLPKRKSFETRPTKNAVLKSTADLIRQLKREKDEALKREVEAKKSAEYYENMCKDLILKLNEKNITERDAI